MPYVPALPFGSIWELLQGQAGARAGRPAIETVDLATGERTTIAYNELPTAVARCANYLQQQHGVSAGDHFGFIFDNRAEVLLLSLSAAILGATCVPLDARRDVVERMVYKMRVTEAKALLTHPRGSDARAWRAKLARLRTEAPGLRVDEFDERRSLVDAIADRPAAPRFAIASDLSRVQVTLFTSGTTADPKGAQLTGHNLLLNAQGIGRWLHIGPEDRFGAILPLHHINSTVFSLATLLAGGSLVLLSEPPRDAFWDVMADEAITLTSIVQKMLSRILELSDRHSACRQRLRLSRIQIGSDFVDAHDAQAFVEATGIPLQQGYGLTEVAFRATGVPYGLPDDIYRLLVRKNAIGRAIDGSELCVMGPNGEPLGSGDIGELCMRGPMVMAGYLGNPAATEAAFAGGWFHSGDLGWFEEIDGERYYFYHSRHKEIIKKGGAMISPAAIDRAILATFPELEDAYAFGYPDPAWGEAIWLAVTFRDGVPAARRGALPSEIVAAGQQESIAGLPRFEAPTRVLDWEADFPGVDLPRTSTLKIQRARLKALVEARLSTGGS